MITIPGPKLGIGRGTANELQFDDLLISLDHASIEETEGAYLLIDLGSEYGTYVNEGRVQRHQLADNDKIEIGPYSFRFYLPVEGQPAILQYEEEPVQAVTVTPGFPPVETRALRKEVNYRSVYSLSTRFFTKTALSLCLIVVILGVVMTLWAWGKVSYLTPGELSSQHRLFEKDCVRCHTPWQRVSDEACLKCHDSAVHHENQIVTPTCTTCHGEHEGDITLVSVADRSCIQCHADLQTKDGMLHFGSRIQSFNNGHPEFKVSVKGQQGTEERVRLDDTAHLVDTAQVELNHQVHLKPDLKGPKGPVQLLCKDCHRAAVDGGLMAPVTYEEHCKECHDLSFDPNIPNRLVPHAPPEEVHSYLTMAITERHVTLLPEPERARRLPGPTPSSTRLALIPQVAKDVRVAEKHLYNATCNKCHKLDKTHLPFPEVEKTAIPAVWFPHARFEHIAHRQLKCASCHQDVSKSKKTTDVLLPGIQKCQDCHRPDRTRTDCVTCHLYHDISKKREWDGPFTIQRLLSGGDPEKPGPQPMTTEPRL